MRERTQKPRKKQPQPEIDPTLHPSKHACSDNNGVCWYCGEPENKHREKVVVKDGVRMVVSTNR